MYGEKKIRASRVQLLRANHTIQKVSSPPKKVVTKEIIPKKLNALHLKISEKKMFYQEKN